MSVTPNADTNPPHHLTDVGEMVFNFLDSHGYDGLANLREECGCGFKPDAQEVTPNFPPCGNFNPNCRPAFLVTFPASTRAKDPFSSTPRRARKRNTPPAKLTRAPTAKHRETVTATATGHDARKSSRAAIPGGRLPVN